MPEDAIEVEIYSGHYFEDYYYSILENKLYYNNGVRIRAVTPKLNENRLIYHCRDINNK